MEADENIGVVAIGDGDAFHERNVAIIAASKNDFPGGALEKFFDTQSPVEREILLVSFAGGEGAWIAPAMTGIEDENARRFWDGKIAEREWIEVFYDVEGMDDELALLHARGKGEADIDSIPFREPVSESQGEDTAAAFEFDGIGIRIGNDTQITETAELRPGVERNEPGRNLHGFLRQDGVMEITRWEKIRIVGERDRLGRDFPRLSAQPISLLEPVAW